MVFIKLTALFSILAVATADPAYSFLALRSASPIHYKDLSANGGKIWIGKPTSSDCPVNSANCLPGKVTAIDIASSGTASMAVAVPGGQQLYIDPTGALSFTQPHSAYIPPGSKTTGFTLTNGGSNGIEYLASCEGGFLACPVDHKGNGPWQVFVDLGGKLRNEDVPSKDKNNCLSFTAAGAPTGSFAAWEYN